VTVEPAYRRIRTLPALVANQIAAGEVVERPASVVKEIVENAIDAGASRIVVELEQGGTELVRITDDGRGILADDLPLAVAPHATSKIADVTDLDHIGTLGFRGEALASIASVSRMTIRSRTIQDASANVLEIEGDAIKPVAPAAGPVGTCVTVRNLFFNTPARRKFLRTITTEQQRCLEVVRELAMAHPAIAFTASADGRVLIDVPGAQSAKERALAILGRELAPELLEVHADAFDDSRGVALWGMVGRPAVARATSKSQYIFVNGRCIRDKTIQHAIGEAFRGLIEPGRYPTAVLMLEMSPAGVDVNVHPAKAEVRFRDSSLVHSIVLRAIREALRSADLTPTISTLRPNIGGGVGALDSLPGAGRVEDRGTPVVHANPQAFVDYFKRMAPAPRGEAFSYGAIKESLEHATDRGEVASAPGPGAIFGGMGGASSAPPAPDALPTPTPTSRILQVHKSYLVTQDDQGVIIIDQHALHERVMFEYLIARISDPGSAGLESQRLLTPVVVPATPTRVDKLVELKPLLDRIGVVAEPMSPNTIGVQAFPTFLFDRGVDPLDFLDDLFQRAEHADFAPGSEESLREVLDMMACKAAVKAGDRMSEVELNELAKLREEVERSSNCPHGRPTSIRLSIRELERLFGRT
jgi:DNA mismatch repair protein MutL